MKQVMMMCVLVAVLSCPAWAGLESSIYASYLDSKDVGTGWGLGLKTELNLWKWLGIDTRISYVDFDAGGVYMVPLEAALVLNIPIADQRINPYGGIGVGYYIMNASNVGLDDEVGYFPLLGIKLGAKSVSFMGEVRWLGLESSYKNGSDNTVNVDSIGANLGVVFRW